VDHICPHLGLESDRSSVALFACDAHCCAVRDGKLALAWQHRYCLTESHRSCQFFERACESLEPPLDTVEVGSERGVRRPFAVWFMFMEFGMLFSVVASLVLGADDGSAQGTVTATESTKVAYVVVSATPTAAPTRDSAVVALPTMTPVRTRPTATPPGPSPTATPPPPTATPSPTATATVTRPEASPFRDSTPLPSPTASTDTDSVPGELETPAQDADGIVHVVVEGETLASIAALYGVSVDEIASINSLADVNVIHAGQQLFIPSPAESSAITGP
jgi:LysM repeat protein